MRRFLARSVRLARFIGRLRRSRRIFTQSDVSRMRANYAPLDAIAEAYAAVLKRICRRMKNIMHEAFVERIAPIYTEARRAQRLAANNADASARSTGRELERLLSRYSDMVEAEIAAAVVLINELWAPARIRAIIESFVDTVNEAERRILLQEILDEAGRLSPATYENLDNGVDSLLDDTESNLADYTPVIAREYIERTRAGLLEALIGGATAAYVMGKIYEWGEMADRKCVFVATESTNALYAELSYTRQTNLNIEYFRWMTLHGTGGDDGRVRDEHKKRNGKVYRWGRGAGPKNEHPGEPYGCRCKALPVIGDDWEYAGEPTVNRRRKSLQTLRRSGIMLTRNDHWEKQPRDEDGQFASGFQSFPA